MRVQRKNQQESGKMKAVRGTNDHWYVKEDPCGDN